ncbi:MAG: TadE/TadG family type IV pilus assembly protein [Anderseniella sp.]
MKFVRAFGQCAKGAVALSMALSAPVLFAVAGVAIDYGFLIQKRAALQGLSDAASTAAAAEFPTTQGNVTALKAIAKAFVDAKAGDFDGNLSINVASNETSGAVTVTLTHAWTPFFAHFLDTGVTPVSAVSTARSIGSGKICMIALRPKANKALHVLQNATLIADGCAVYSNSTHKHSIWIDNNGSVTADLVCAAGGIKYKKMTSVKPDATEDCPPVPDPLAGRSAPPSNMCPKNAPKLVISNETRTLSPGTYCGGIRIEGTSKVKFQPGVFVIKDGPFEVVDSAKIKGKNTGFFLTGTNATLRFEGNTSIDLVAPKDGALAGLLFFEDRNAKAGNVHVINSDDARVLLGTIYLPLGTLRVAANAPVADKSAYTAIIADMLDLDEGPDLVLHSDYGSTDVPVPEGLIGGRVVLTR